MWLKQVFNAIVFLKLLEDQPDQTHLQGKGKDPLETSSFRGVALSSTIAKLLEYIKQNICARARK